MRFGRHVRPEDLHLIARGLRVRAGGIDIIHPLELALRGGEFVALLGPSGSGKSTLLRALCGYVPGEGTVHAFGRNLYDEMDELRKRIGYVPQDDVLHRSLKTEAALRYAAKLRLTDADEARIERSVEEALERVGLRERRHVRIKRLSGGQRKRVSVAMELLSRPQLFFLDEPTSGLDPALEAQLMTLLRRLTGPDRITLVTTHVLSSLEHVDLIVMLAGGRIAYIGPPGEAAAFFGESDLAAAYRRVAAEDPARLALRFRNTPAYRRFVAERL